MAAQGTRTAPPPGREALASLYPRAHERPGLLDWIEDPRPDAGYHFADDDGGWTFWDYPRIARLAASAARQIEELRSRPAGPVSIVTRTGPEFIAAFVGTLLAGHVPSPLALPVFARDRQRYVDHAASIMRAADPALVVVDEGVQDVLADAATAADLGHSPHTLALDEDDDTSRRTPAELALLQFTSGSSGRPRGVRVTWENLESNIAMIRGWLEMGPNEQTATWLPLYHDMGLIGCFLTPMVNQSDVWIMRPDQFIADPLRWIDCFGSRGVEIGVGPNFAFAYAAKRLSDEALEGMDFSAWRIAIVGAERLDPAVLGGFAKRLQRHGFRGAGAFLPAYGLAEATLATTGVPHAAMPRAVRPDWDRARFGAELPIAEEAPLSETDRIGAGDGWVVGCGGAHPGVAVEIVDEDGAALPDGYLGEIAVEGLTIADGYEGGGQGSTRFEGRRLRTGDAGFTSGGELFVMGRLGDSVKVRGRTVFVEDVEARLATVDGIQKGKCVVLAGTDATRETLVALVEAPPGEWSEGAATILLNEVGRDAVVKVLAGGPGTIERTSSGKPRRRVMWTDLVAGRLDAEVVFDSGAR